jgi:methylase of polypeptide subunit release factors
MNDKTTALLDLLRVLQKHNYQYTAVTPLTHERVNARLGNAWARDLQDIFGWSRPFEGAVVPDELLALMQQAGIVVPHKHGWRSLVRISTLDGMLFMHSAYPTMAADAVFFGPDTYRFAQAIEQFLASETASVSRAIDVGCGAGPGAIVIAKARPAAKVLAVDINEHALDLTRLNAAFAGAVNVEARYSNLLNDVDGDFHLIVANPPYLVDPSARAYRHGGGPLGAGLALAIIEASIKRIAPHGTLLLYTGVAIVHGEDPFLQSARALLQGSGLEWDYREIDPDIFGEELLTESYAETDRIAAVVLTVRRPG